MNWIKFTIIGVFLVFTGTTAIGQATKKLVIGEQPVFKVKRANQLIVVDGKMDEAVWSQTEARAFNYFYRVEKPDDRQKMLFRMLWDDRNLYVFFEAEDKYITARETKRDGQPYFDDCAEVFFITVPDSLDTHIGYELNLYKAANDFVYFNDFLPGQSVAMKSFNPEYQVEVQVNGTINDNSDIDKGWSMEMAIPLENFGGLEKFSPVQPGNKWAFLAVRQDRNDAEGERRSTSTIFPIYEIEKNVHQANRFGLMEFVK
ncbi:carbohydrate-binding family 9-like protein [uncultured Draconibacterium sp.]|uniref:carbohydrate-binding family 9-like protein n=1 Tax=uncultured Draconibacterium sp. TaxID=1573823 RepID=UPI003261B7C5